MNSKLYFFEIMKKLATDSSIIENTLEITVFNWINNLQIKLMDQVDSVIKT